MSLENIEIRYGSDKLNGGTNSIAWTTPMSSKPVVVTTLIGTGTESVGSIRVSNVSVNGFSVSGTYTTNSGTGSVSKSSTDYMWLAICQKGV